MTYWQEVEKAMLELREHLRDEDEISIWYDAMYGKPKSVPESSKDS